jgi:hypothetical protein
MTYAKKPVQVKALKFEYSTEGIDALKDFCGDHLMEVGKARSPNALGWAEIGTLEDGQGLGAQVKHIATEGDYIIQGVKGEFYACKPDIFEMTYEVVLSSLPCALPDSRTLQHVDGDLIKMALNSEFDIIVHGCNCFHTMGSGIAKSIKETWPEAYLADLRSRHGDARKLGSFTVHKAATVLVVNFYTQYEYNKAWQFRDVFEYGAFERGLSDMLLAWPTSRIGIPEIGMGKACGDRTRILEIIDRVLKKSDFKGTLTMVKFKEDKSAA